LKGSQGPLSYLKNPAVCPVLSQLDPPIISFST
jgi:hypothetical protein